MKPVISLAVRSGDTFTRRVFTQKLGALGAGLAAAIVAPAVLAQATVPAARPREVIIDTDPGQDDAIAILFALAAPHRLNVKALTVVGGNVPLAVTGRNACMVRDWAGRTDLPVYLGCSQPLMQAAVTAENIHGVSGLDGAPLHEPRAPASSMHAVRYLVDTLQNAPAGSVTVCALGPLTNIAAALIEQPAMRQGIREIVVMGGAYFETGNKTPSAEFNIYADPHAADIVFRSGVPLVVLPRDVCVKLPATAEHVAALRKLGNRAGEITAGILESAIARATRRLSVPWVSLYDPSTIGYLLEPSLFKGKLVNVAIETRGEYTLGATVVDWRERTGRKPNALWMNDVDATGFFRLMVAHIARLP